MSTVSQPGVNIGITSGTIVVPNIEQKVLFVGQKTSAGTATAGKLIENIGADGSESTLFGANSMLAEMVREARAINKDTQFDAIAVDDSGTGVATTFLILPGGDATTDVGDFDIIMGSDNHKVNVTVPAGTSVADVADAITAAVNADTSAPFTASETGDIVTLTAVNAGTYGNTVGLSLQGTLPGQALVLTPGAVGAGDPTLTGVLDVIGDARYQTIVWPYPGDTDPLTDLLDSRFNATDEVLDGVGIVPDIGSASSLVSTYSGVNSQSLTVIGDDAVTEIATDVVVNGDFAIDSDWTKGTGWTISGGTANFTGTASADLEQSPSPALVGDDYLAIVTVSSFVDSGSGGTANIKVGGISGTAITADGTYVQAISSLSPSNSVGVEAIPSGGSLTFSVDNLMIYQKTLGIIDSTANVPSIFEIPAVTAALVGSVRGLRRTDGANIISFLSGAVGLDGIGGPALSSRPYANTPFTTLPVPDVGTGFLKQEIEDLFDVGVTVLGSNPARTGVILGETTTTYKTDGAGNPDPTFKFLNYVDTASAVREYMYNNLKAIFAQSRLTSGDTTPGRPGANIAFLTATMTDLYSALSGPDFALTQAGEAPLQSFKNGLTITIDGASGTATILMASVPIVTQLRQINAVLTITFSPDQ